MVTTLGFDLCRCAGQCGSSDKGAQRGRVTARGWGPMTASPIRTVAAAEPQGFVLITWPEGEITYHSPPLMSNPCPVALPGAVSDTNVYSGQPA